MGPEGRRRMLSAIQRMYSWFSGGHVQPTTRCGPPRSVPRDVLVPVTGHEPLTVVDKRWGPSNEGCLGSGESVASHSSIRGRPAARATAIESISPVLTFRPNPRSGAPTLLPTIRRLLIRLQVLGQKREDDPPLGVSDRMIEPGEFHVSEPFRPSPAAYGIPKLPGLRQRDLVVCRSDSPQRGSV